MNIPWESIFYWAGRISGLLFLDLVLVLAVFAVPLGLPGNFVIIAAALVAAWATGFTSISWVALLVMLTVAIAAEVIEALLGTLVAGKYGASKWGMIGAFAGGILGGVIGTAMLPVIGTVIGSFAGTAVGAPLLEWSRGATSEEGVRAGFGAFVGRSLAAVIKLAVAVGMCAYIIEMTHS